MDLRYLDRKALSSEEARCGYESLIYALGSDNLKMAGITTERVLDTSDKLNQLQPILDNLPAEVVQTYVQRTYRDCGVDPVDAYVERFWLRAPSDESIACLRQSEEFGKAWVEWAVLGEFWEVGPLDQKQQAAREKHASLLSDIEWQCGVE